MSRRAHKQTSVSLFPFLAVLLCAMGALIFLLVITTRMIHSEALQRQQVTSGDPFAPPSAELGRAQGLPGRAIARNAPAPLVAPKPVFVKRDLPPPPPDLTAQLRTLREELERLNGLQRRGVEEAQQLYARLAALRKESDDKRKALARAAQITAQMQTQRAANARTIEQGEERSQGLSKELQDDRRELSQRQSKLQKVDDASQIVAYDSRNNTTRRPILIECRSDRLVFMPEGIELTARDLAGFTPVNNPLLAGVSALSNYWSHVDGAVTDRDRPYVLLIVRPDGIAAFWEARRLLHLYDQPNGYELIPSDEKLTYGAGDDSAAALCRAAINHLLKERGAVPEALVSSVFESHVRRPGGSDSASGRGGGRGNRHSSSLKPGRYEFRRTGRGMELVRIDGPSNDVFHREVRPPRTTRRGEPKRNVVDNRRQLFDGEPKQNADSPQRLPLAEAAREAADINRGGSRLEEGVNPRLVVPGQKTTWMGENGTGRGQSDSGTAQAQNDAWTGQFDEPSSSMSVEERQQKGLTPDEDQFLSALGIREDYPQPTLTEDQLATQQQKAAGSRRGGVAGDPFAPHASNAQQNDAEVSGGLVNGRTRYIAFGRQIIVRIGRDAIRVEGEEPISIAPGVSSDALLGETLRTMRHHVGNWGPPPKSFYWKPMLRFIVSPGGLQYYERLQPYFKQRKLLSDVEFPIATGPETVDYPRLTQ